MGAGRLIAVTSAVIFSALACVLDAEVANVALPKCKGIEEIYAENTSALASYILPAPELEHLDSGVCNYDYRLADDLIEYAKQFMGTRYRRGGKTPSGFDCSGFTGYVFRQFGYLLGASSSVQALQGDEVMKEDVLPGDLLLFNGRRVGSNVGHVGIAIAYDHDTGEITFIHSAIGGGIRIDKTSSPYYKLRYLGARRIIKKTDTGK